MGVLRVARKFSQVNVGPPALEPGTYGFKVGCGIRLSRLAASLLAGLVTALLTVHLVNPPW